MENKTLTPSATKVIEDYLHFRLTPGGAECSVPYFNNKVSRTRAGLRAQIGKGSPKEIAEEALAVLIKRHASVKDLTSDTLKKLLVEENLGIDCSAYAYYILDAFCRDTGNGHLNRHLSLHTTKSPLARMRNYLRPVENTSVKAFASDTNSRIIPLGSLQPGDIISMMGMNDAERDHILIVTDVTCSSGQLTSFTYTHAIAYPEDGRFGTGVKLGKVDISFPGDPVTKQVWSESGSTEGAQRIFARALASTTDVRRLKWLP